jgi:hypothetical protein
VKENTLNGIDIARFKSEVDKLLSRSIKIDESLKSSSTSLETTKQKPPMKKQRRISKSTNNK